MMKAASLMLQRACGAYQISTPAQASSTKTVAPNSNPKEEVRDADASKTFGKCAHIQESSHNESYITIWRKTKTQMI